MTEADPDERSRAGLFMAFQYPVAIPGVSVSKYLRMIINAQREARGEEPDQDQRLRQASPRRRWRWRTSPKTSPAATSTTASPAARRSGWSCCSWRCCGRRSRSSTRPTPASTSTPCARSPRASTSSPGPDMGVLIITHYQRILHMVKPDFVHVMFEGRIVKEGGPELVERARGEGLRLDPRGGRGGRYRLTSGNMEPTTTERSSPAAAFPIEKVRAAFPALEREVHGQPVAYLDSGASAQRVLASIQAVDRYERSHHSNVHRGSHTLSAEATAAYEGARATVADHLGAADRREVIFVRNATEAINLVARAWGDANVGAGDRIVLTEMEHHSNIVPWQQLAERVGAEIDWVPVGDGGAARHGGLRGAAGARPEARRGHPRLQRARHREPVGGDLTAGARGRRAGPRRRRPGGAEAAARRRRAGRRLLRRSPATSSTRRPGSGRSGRGSTCCGRCRPSSAAAR